MPIEPALFSALTDREVKCHTWLMSGLNEGFTWQRGMLSLSTFVAKIECYILELLRGKLRRGCRHVNGCTLFFKPPWLRGAGAILCKCCFFSSSGNQVSWSIVSLCLSFAKHAAIFLERLYAELLPR